MPTSWDNRDLDEFTFKEKGTSMLNWHRGPVEYEDLICSKCGRRIRDKSAPTEEMFDCKIGGYHEYIKNKQGKK